MKSTKLKTTFLLLLTVVFFHSTPLLSAEQSQDQSETLTVVAGKDNLPFSFSLPDGTPSGLYVEFWELWSKTNNIPIRILLVPFEESLQLARQKNTLHVGLFRNEQREQWADFSLPIHNVQTGIIYNRTVNKNTKLRELNDIKISTARFSFQELYIREKYPDIEQLTYENFDNVFNQLLDNDIQAVIVELPTAFAQLAKKGLSGVFVISEEVITSNNVFALLTKGQPELLDRVNTGIENIPVNKIIELEKKWLPTLKPFFGNNSSLTSLTLAERKWLKQLPSLRLGVDSWYPYEYFNDKGDFSGISADYISYIKNILSLTIEADKSYSWAEALAAMKNNKIDVMSAIVRTTEREKTMFFTDPYVSTHTVLVSRKNGFNADSLASLQGRTIGIVAENAVLTFVATDYPKIIIIPVSSTIDGLEKLNDGKIDSFLGDISFINFTINEEQLSDLIITGFSPYKLEISMAVRTELEPLVGILNKVFLNMSEKKKVAIANDWLSIQLTTGPELSTIALWVLPIASFIMLVVILIFFRMNKKLKIEIGGRKESEKIQGMLVSQLHQSQKMEALGKLTGGIAHDFNNILVSIIGYSHLASEQFSSENKQLASYLNTINKAGARARDLIANMLAFSRHHSQKPELIEIYDVFTETLNLLTPTIPSSIKLTVDCQKDISPLMLDPTQFQQVMMNLVINARDALSDNGKINIVLKSVNDTCHSCHSCFQSFSGSFLVLSVTDNGSGISKQDISRIFEPFFTTKTSEKGSGMGLSVTHGIVHAHNGHIRVHSIANQETKFSLYFPYQENKLANELEKEDKLVAKLEKGDKKYQHCSVVKGKNILVVDDEPMILNFLSTYLGYHDLNVITASNGRLALEKFDEFAIDLLVTDLTMPEMTGLELCRKAKHLFPQMPIIVCSGYSEEIGAHNIDKFGINHFHAKPSSPDELLAAIIKLLKRDTTDGAS